MKELKNRILEDGKALNETVLKVDTFLNHQVDSKLMYNMGTYFKEYFKKHGITRILTIESSGIAPTAMTAMQMDLPMVILKKQQSKILNGNVYHLSKNKGNDNLHSGPDVYQKRLWKTLEADDRHVVFELYSPDGDQGYPGAMNVRVTYELKEDNGLYISYCAESDADTIWNMTNHAYFNLNGHESGTILAHELLVNADGYTETDEGSIPTGRIIPVEGTPMDFRVKKVIGRDIEENYKALVDGNGYDHNWTINGDGFRKAAELTGNESGITMEVYTDRPGVQVYAGNYLNDEQGKAGAIYGKRSGICFETQNYPDAIHHSEFPNPVLLKGEVLKTSSMYRFL